MYNPFSPAPKQCTGDTERRCRLYSSIVRIGETVGEWKKQWNFYFDCFSSDIVTYIQRTHQNNKQHSSARTTRSQRKRGRRGGVLARFRKRTHHPPLPSVLLSNVRPLKNKFDEVVYLIQKRKDYSDCCVFCFTETRLDPLTPDSAVLPDDYTLHRADRAHDLSGNSKRVVSPST